MRPTSVPGQCAPEPSRSGAIAIALYPLRGDALLMLAVLTVSGILAWLPGIAGIVLALIIYFAGYRYAFEVMLATAHGRPEAPVIVVNAQGGAVWRLLVLLLALLLAIYLTHRHGMDGAGLTLLALFTLLQPAILIALASDSGLLAALNPANALRIIGSIGATYFLVAGALFLIQLLVLLAARMLALSLPGFFASLLADALFYWGLFASFHLLGLTVYRHHDRLGYTPARHAEALPTQQDRDQALLDEAIARTNEGDAPGAIRLLRDAIRERPVTLAVHEHFRQLLHQAGDSAALDEHAGRWLGVLLLEKQDRRALALLREALDSNPSFAPLDADQGNALAKRAIDLGQFRLAADTWRSVLQRDPRHPDAPRWALQCAQLLHERFGDTASARDVLTLARTQCRDDATAAELDAALQALPAD